MEGNEKPIYFFFKYKSIMAYGNDDLQHSIKEEHEEEEEKLLNKYFLTGIKHCVSGG